MAIKLYTEKQPTHSGLWKCVATKSPRLAPGKIYNVHVSWDEYEPYATVFLDGFYGDPIFAGYGKWEAIK